MKPIYTAADFGRAVQAAAVRATGDSPDDADLRTLGRHQPHRQHCGGYEVLAWPCPEAAEVLHRLLDGDL